MRWLMLGGVALVFLYSCTFPPTVLPWEDRNDPNVQVKIQRATADANIRNQNATTTRLIVERDAAIQKTKIALDENATIAAGQRTQAAILATPTPTSTEIPTSTSTPSPTESPTPTPSSIRPGGL